MKAKTALKAAGGMLVLVALAHVSYGLAHRLYNSASAGDHSFTSDFESGTFDVWTQRGAIQTCCDHSLQIVEQPTRAGRGAARFELRRSDPDVKGSKRAEIRMKAGAMGSEYWHAFSVYLPSDWEPDQVPTTLAQWHGVPDVWLAEAGRSPPLRLAALEGEWLLVNVWDSKRVTAMRFVGGEADGWTSSSLGELGTGRWTDWVFHIRWSAAEDGLLEVWKNGELAFERAGPNAYNDALGPYLKLGLYVPEWGLAQTRSTVRRRIAYFDAVRVADRPATVTELSPGS